MKKIYSCLLLALFMMWSTSCSDYLEFEETDLIAGDIALQTVANVETALMGGYANVDNFMGILLNSVFADEVKTAGEFYNASTTHEWKYGPADVGLRDSYTAIDPQYRVVDRANRVLSRVDIADSTRVGDNVLRKRLKAEALFLRAFAHFELFRFYGAKYDPATLAMPYMDFVNVKQEPQARIPAAEYFAKMNQDISDAKANLPNNLTDINRANVATANGLQARIALYSEQWADAEAYATNYINTPGLALATIASFPGIWNDANTNEQSYRMVRTSAQTRLGTLFRASSGSASAPGTITWTVSNKLYDSYATADVRRGAYFITDPTLVSLNRPNADRPGLIINKYNPYPTGGFGQTSENLVNGKMMRTAEMYLIRAEARAEQDNLAGAESDLNTLRTNRITGYTPITLSTKQQAIDEILLERSKELAFEGHRFWDLKRKGLPVARIAADAPSADGTTLPANDFRFALPIPDPEMKANKLIQQNPGY
ncbi:MAG TPA: RagB/SusD family nutrient uptake outer membrane protein [Cyclobacteriaceae bacterium]|nr:RagB/SusD family nutrient uptake outer membrane protein [Cyclobacteriaceae bacterium]